MVCWDCELKQLNLCLIYPSINPKGMLLHISSLENHAAILGMSVS